MFSSSIASLSDLSDPALCVGCLLLLLLSRGKGGGRPSTDGQQEDIAAQLQQGASMLLLLQVLHLQQHRASCCFVVAVWPSYSLSARGFFVSIQRSVHARCSKEASPPLLLLLLRELPPADVHWQLVLQPCCFQCMRCNKGLVHLLLACLTLDQVHAC